MCKSKVAFGEFFGFIFIFILLLVACYFVSTRPLNSPDDTYSYYSFLKSIRYLVGEYDGRFEILFVFITKLAVNLSENHYIYFGFLFVVLNLFYFILYLELSFNHLPKTHIIIFFSFLFLSGWYYTSSVNGIRHGLAAPLVIMSMLRFLNGKYISSVFLFIVSLGFHTSGILILPFYALLKIRYKTFSFIFFFVALFYPLGINEAMIKLLSDYSGIGVYEAVKFYLDDGLQGWVGFQYQLFLYSVFWFFLIHIGRRFTKPELIYFIERFNIVYGSLCMVYFVFGFGNFSNRYAFVAWCFIPILQYAYYEVVDVRNNIKQALVVFLLSISYSVFLLRLNLILS